MYNENDDITFGLINYIKYTPSEKILNDYYDYKYKYYNDNIKEFFYKTKELYNQHRDINHLWYSSFMCFSNRLTFNKKGEMNASFGKRLAEEKLKHIDNFKSIEITNDDYRIHLFTKFNENDFIFMDPPYYLSEKYGTKCYKNTWGEDEEKSFLNFLRIMYDNDVKYAVTNIVEYKGHIHSKLLELIDELSLNYICINNKNNSNGNVNADYKEYFIYNYDVE